MHILETYALIAGAKIDKCYIQEMPVILPVNQYITFHPYSEKGNSKQYDKWDSVIDLLNKNKNFNYDILQIGTKDPNKNYNVNTDYLNQLNRWQLAYLIKNSSLHLGYDSFPIHLSSHYNIPIVGLYSYHANTCGPYFSSTNKVKLFQPDFTKIKPTYGYNDQYRLINNIDYINIYYAILELLRVTI